MPDPAAFGPAILIGLVLLVMLWFTFGTQRNIRKGNHLLGWLQVGLPILGRRTTMRWLGSSAVELAINDAAAPFRDAMVVVVLEPRDVGILWAYARARGRRDFLIVRANLERAPRFSLHLGDPRGWTSSIEAPSADDGWEPVGWPGGVLIAQASAGADEELARTAWERLQQSTGGVWRLTIQPVRPHLEVHVRPPDTARIPADRFLRVIGDLAGRLTRP